MKRIDIRGFKTFSKKVSVALDQGFTVITGPNGSGKSNILDALKFSLGELSPKELRGRSLGDLVHKSQGEGAKSAHVAVQFDNTDRKIPVDSDLVTVSREFSKGGEGVYRVNGRRLSRKQVQDILSSADIQVTGFNMIAQHAITRLAEISPDERRRILEDLIGIGVFETKKAEARVQLQEADVNLKVAAAKVDEVRQRIEQLERERNDLLRHNLLRDEVRKQQSIILSSEILGLEGKKTIVQKGLDEEVAKLEETRKEREGLTEERTQVEEERRKFEESTVSKGSQELFEVERKIAAANADVVRAETEMESRRTILETRNKQLAALQKKSEAIEESIKRIADSQRNLSNRRSGLDERLTAITKELEKLDRRLGEARESLGQDSEKRSKLDEEINLVSKELAKASVASKGSSTTLNLTADQLHSLETRQKEYSQLTEDLKERIREMERIEKQEEKRLEELELKVKEYSELKMKRRDEIEEALEVAKKARVTVVEFNTQKGLADTLGTEDKAISRIEEMAEEGAIKGVLGRLEELVKYSDEHRKAVEAASAGWMKALVVKDVGVAIKCVESLKRAKLGRAKIVPLDLEPSANEFDYDDIPGVVGPLSRVVKAEKQVMPAVEFVFGDTLLATSQRGAFIAASRGLRCVVTTGDLYEPGGALESGYYRAPLDVTSLIPRTSALEGLEKTVRGLELVVQKQRSDVDRLESELDRLRMDHVVAGKNREWLVRQLTGAKATLERTRTGLQQTRRRTESLQSTIERETVLLGELTEKQGVMKKRLEELEKERVKLRVDARLSSIREMERERELLSHKLDGMLREKLEAESKLEYQKSSLETLRPGVEQVRVEARTLESDVKREEAHVAEARKTLGRVQESMKDLETEKSRLVESLGAVNEGRRKFELRLGEMEKTLRTLLARMDPITARVSDLKGSVRELDAQLIILYGQLRELGLEKPLEGAVKRPGLALEWKKTLEEEMRDIGAVNQLAVEQYDSQKDGYKQLSVRINELEREKLSIIDFMNQLDRRKKEAFMGAYNRVNGTFQSLFSEMTDERGNGRMVLDNVENPFEGGLELLLQFPGKPELTVGSASGGEKSVSTVCYLLALQQIHPMPFYVMDEIDAHLDVVNSRRLATLLRSRSKESQFIVISLKDMTISCAERVYGVYAEKGVSNVVSLPALSGNN